MKTFTFRLLGKAKEVRDDKEGNLVEVVARSEGEARARLSIAVHPRRIALSPWVDDHVHRMNATLSSIVNREHYYVKKTDL